MLDGQWVSFVDEEELKYACMDAVVLTPRVALIVECKLTWTDEAWWQLESKYLRLAEVLWPDRIAVGLQMCKNLCRGTRPRFVEGIAELLEAPASGRWTWNWES